MIKYILPIVFSFLMMSCATLLNKDSTYVTIVTQQPAEIYYNLDTFKTSLINNENYILLEVPRNKAPLKFGLKNDSLYKKIIIDSKVSSQYYYNVFNMYGFLLDLSSHKRYKYPEFLAFNDSLELIFSSSNASDTYLTNWREFKNPGYILEQKKKLHKKGNLYYNLTFPFIYPSLSSIKTDVEGRKKNASLLGLAGSIEYYYKSNRFINLSAGIIFAGDMAFGCTFEPYDEDRVNIYNINISHNHWFNKFSFGYGLSYTINDWWKYAYDLYDDYHFPDDPENIDRYFYSYEYKSNKYSILGFVINGYYYLSPSIGVGAIYKPGLVRLSPNGGTRFVYEHQISLDFAFKIRLKKGKR